MEGDSNPRGLPHENTPTPMKSKKLIAELESHAITTRPSIQLMMEGVLAAIRPTYSTLTDSIFIISIFELKSSRDTMNKDY